MILTINAYQPSFLWKKASLTLAPNLHLLLSNGRVNCSRCNGKVGREAISSYQHWQIFPVTFGKKKSATLAIFLSYLESFSCLWKLEQATHSTNKKQVMRMTIVWKRFWLVREFRQIMVGQSFGKWQEEISRRPLSTLPIFQRKNRTGNSSVWVA